MSQFNDSIRWATRQKLQHTDSDHQKLPRADHVHHTVGVLEDLQHHLLLVRRWRLSFRMSTWVNDTVHIQVQIVHLISIGVGTRGVHGNLFAVDFLRKLLDNGGDDLRILVGEPSEKRWDTHDC